MGKDHGRREAEQQSRERELQAQQQLAQANKKTPLQEELEKSDLDFLTGIRSPTFDIRDPKLGLNPYLSLYESATKARTGERAGSGLIKLGTNAANPNITARLNRQADDRRVEEAGGALERAFRLRNAEVTGSALPLIQTEVSKNIALANLTGGRADNSWAQYYNIRRMPTAWESVRDNFARGAGEGLSVVAGGGVK